MKMHHIFNDARDIGKSEMNFIHNDVLSGIRKCTILLTMHGISVIEKLTLFVNNVWISDIGK